MGNVSLLWLFSSWMIWGSLSISHCLANACMMPQTHPPLIIHGNLLRLSLNSDAVAQQWVHSQDVIHPLNLFQSRVEYTHVKYYTGMSHLPHLTLNTGRGVWLLSRIAADNYFHYQWLTWQIVKSVKCQKIAKNAHHNIPKPKMIFSDALFCLANSIKPSIKYFFKNQLIIKIVAD